MTGIEITLIIAITAMGAMVQGCLGIGIGLVAAPVLVSIDPSFAPGPLLFIGQVVGIRHVVAERKHIDRPALKNSLIGLPFGLGIGLAILVMVDERVLSIIVGSATAIASLALIAGLTAPRSRVSEVMAGGLCAFASITAALPGPPLVVAFSDMKPSTMRGTASVMILSVAVIAAVGLVSTGEFAGEELRLLLLLVPGAVIGLLLARILRPRIDSERFRTAVLVMAALGGAALAIRQLI